MLNILIGVVTPPIGLNMFIACSIARCPVGEFTRELYSHTGVSLLDASAFGAGAEGHVRVSCTVPDDELREACRRMADWLGRPAPTGATP